MENAATVSGGILHENVHDPFFGEKRNGCIFSRAMAIHSASLGLSGECDLLEFTESADGVPLAGRAGRYAVCPVEYKRGAQKTDDCDRLQLAAQVMCLEEMFVCDIPSACLFYHKTRRREYVPITEQLREAVVRNVTEMHQYYAAGYTPRVKKTAKCRGCSLYDICLPSLPPFRSVDAYMRTHMEE